MRFIREALVASLTIGSAVIPAASKPVELYIPNNRSTITGDSTLYQGVAIMIAGDGKHSPHAINPNPISETGVSKENQAGVTGIFIQPAPTGPNPWPLRK